jgi:hypothetical protein
MVNIATLDTIIRQAAVEAIDGTGRSHVEVLCNWLVDSEALERVVPLILVRYRMALRGQPETRHGRWLLGRRRR